MRASVIRSERRRGGGEEVERRRGGEQERRRGEGRQKELGAGRRKRGVNQTLSFPPSTDTVERRGLTRI